MGMFSKKAKAAAAADTAPAAEGGPWGGSAAGVEDGKATDGRVASGELQLLLLLLVVVWA
jgi:hypothetical protein